MNIVEIIAEPIATFIEIVMIAMFFNAYFGSKFDKKRKEFVWFL